MSDLSNFITVEEAALRLGVSPATVRRRAASGELAAQKSGRAWLIDATRLPRRRPRRAAASPPVDATTALGHVRATDLAELFVPDVLRFEDLLDDPEAVCAEALSRFRGASVDAALEVDIDKTSVSTRTAVLLSLPDRVAYQAAVASIAPKIEAATPDQVYSARLGKSLRYFFEQQTREWARWRRDVLQQLESGYEWMAKADLTAYFDTIPHRGLAAEIKSLNPDARVEDTLNEMLRTWTLVSGQGLPQGPNASRLLGNLYLLPVDRAMLAEGHTYSRFMDDVRIVTKTRAEAVAAIRLFESECRRRGLIVSGTKTDVLSLADARRELGEDGDLAIVTYFMDASAANLARGVLKKIMQRALKKEGSVNLRHAKFGLWRLALLMESSMIGRVLQRLEDLAPIASVVAGYLQPFVTKPRVIDGLARFLADPGRSYSDYLETWLFAVMLEHPGTLPSVWADQAARRVKDRNKPAYLRAVAAIVMARSGRSADVEWIRSHVSQEHDPTVLRGYAVALRWARALDANLVRRLTSTAPELEATTAYLKGRADVPSLVYRKVRLPLP